MTGSQFQEGSTLTVRNGRIEDPQNQQVIDLTESSHGQLNRAIENSKSEYGDDLSSWQPGEYRFEGDRLRLMNVSGT